MEHVSDGREIVAHRLRITGRVQGVGFRWFACDAAGRHGVAGWASNEPDGSVLIEAAAERVEMERFLAALRRGPPAAHVAGVAIELRAGSGPLPTPFRIVQ